MSSSPSRAALLSSWPRPPKETPVPPPPIPAWALANRPAVQPPPPPPPAAADDPGRPRGRRKGSRNNADTTSSTDLLDKPRPKRVDERPNYRLKKTRDKNPKKPSRPTSPSPRDVYDALVPTFVHFLCEWQGCRAQLDSFAKLKKHIVVAHGAEVRVTKQCRWAKCGGHIDAAAVVDDAVDPATATTPEKHLSVQHLLRHVDRCHLDPMLWHMGDGRRGRGVVAKHAPEEGAEGYLFRNGSQVTPSVQQQEFETWAELRERQRKVEVTNARAYANAPAVEEGDLEDDH